MTLALLITAATGAWAQEEYESFDLSSGNTNVNGTHFTITGTSGMNSYGLFLSGEFVTVTSLNGENITRVEFIIGLGKSKAENNTGTPGTNSCTNGNENGSITDINATSVTLSTENTGTTSVSIKQITVYYVNSEPSAPDVEVTTNAASEGATLTEATFAMPAGDATVEYELVRDMSVQMPVTVGDGEEGYLIRLKKDEQTNKFAPADMTAQEMKELIKVHDAIEDNDLTFGLLGANCTISIFKVDDDGQPTGEAIAFADLEPGRYVAKATAALNSAYEGETALSNIFELIEAYNVKFIAADDFSQGKIGEVTIDSEAATIDEDGVVKNVKKNSEVKFKAKRGYVFEKAETKKDGELKTLQFTGDASGTFYYVEGETWGEAITNHPTENADFNFKGVNVYYGNFMMFLGAGLSNEIREDSPIDPNGDYRAQDV